MFREEKERKEKERKKGKRKNNRKLMLSEIGLTGAVAAYTERETLRSISACLFKGIIFPAILLLHIQVYHVPFNSLAPSCSLQVLTLYFFSLSQEVFDLVWASEPPAVFI